MKKVFFSAVLIVILAAFFASAHPDGLDFVALKFGFAEKGIERSAPMTDYSVKFLPHGGLSTSLAGLAGVLIILLVFILAVYLLKKGKIFFFFIIMLLVASPAFAARPLVTDDFGTVDSGKYEQETGFSPSYAEVA